MADTRSSTIVRETKETQIKATISLSGNREISIQTGVPFFDHMLHACFFHGGFDLNLEATGDLEVESHHLVEDVGIVLGKAIAEILQSDKAIVRFATHLIPMDDALCRAVVDMSGRPFFVYNVNYPQPLCGNFDMSLLREFLYAFTINAGINMHLEAIYGDNSHHISEALFKAMGKSLGMALTKSESDTILSTKGKILL